MGQRRLLRTLDVQPVIGRALRAPTTRQAARTRAWCSDTDIGSSAMAATLRSLAAHSPRRPSLPSSVWRPGFHGVHVGTSFDVAVPICAEPFTRASRSRLQDRRAWWLAVIGRLEPGWTIERASAQLNAISPALFASTVPPTYRPETVKQYRQFRLGARPASTGVSTLRDDYEAPLWLLLSIAGLVLLIACANLANLMLARATVREREIAVRLAIGASRSRIVRQLLAESLLLAVSAVHLACSCRRHSVRSWSRCSATRWSSSFARIRTRSHSPRRLPSLPACSSGWRRRCARPAPRRHRSSSPAAVVHQRPRDLRPSPHARRRAAGALARSRRRRAPVRADAAEPDARRPRLPQRRRARSSARLQAIGRCRRAAGVAPAGCARSCRTNTRGPFRCGSVHLTARGEWLEQGDHRRRHSAARVQSELGQQRFLLDDGNAGIEGTRFQRSRHARESACRHRQRVVAQVFFGGRDPDRPHVSTHRGARRAAAGLPGRRPRARYQVRRPSRGLRPHRLLCDAPGSEADPVPVAGHSIGSARGVVVGRCQAGDRRGKPEHPDPVRHALVANREDASARTIDGDVVGILRRSRRDHRRCRTLWRDVLHGGASPQ